MNVSKTELPGVLIINPVVHRDDRGFFLETYHQDRYIQHGMDTGFVQDNYSASRQNTLRGLHVQPHNPQCKLVRVVEGEIFDVIVDIRRQSATFCRWVGLHLSSDNYRQCYIPSGYAHGFCVLSRQAHVEYKCSTFYSPNDEISIAWNDPTIGIKWPINVPVLSPRDRDAPSIKEIFDNLPD